MYAAVYTTLVLAKAYITSVDCQLPTYLTVQSWMSDPQRNPICVFVLVKVSYKCSATAYLRY